MANLYTPEQLGIKAPAGGFQQGGWYGGRQYWGGKLSDPGVINPLSNQQGAGQAVSQEVNAASAAKQGVSSQQLESYLQQQRDLQAKKQVQPTSVVNPNPTDLSGASLSEAGLGMGAGTSTTATLNLPDLYKNLYQTQGVAELEETINKKAQAYSEAVSKINDNPWLSEARRSGRQQKLSIDYENSVKNDQNALAMKKQDIVTQIELATKQFDIESTQAKQALDQFNMLLQSGALAGASGNDIASITKATGISSTMIQAAIKAQTDKDVQTSVTTVDDGTNVYSVVINSKTGEIISKQALAASKPRAATEGEKSANLQSQFITALESKKNQYGHVTPSDWDGALASWVARGGSVKDFVANYSQYKSPHETYSTDTADEQSLTEKLISKAYGL